MVSHVDHTEHDIPVIITEHGVAGIRRLDPIERSKNVAKQCGYSKYRLNSHSYIDHVGNQKWANIIIYMY